VSVTDACISWETTERLVRWACDQLTAAPSGVPCREATGMA
jgi:3-deoxy-D-arabino-heptulosonate 7-phosphate (DAHP) synthase